MHTAREATISGSVQGANKPCILAHPLEIKGTEYAVKARSCPRSGLRSCLRSGKETFCES
jgi:hypothetical protein